MIVKYRQSSPDVEPEVVPCPGLKVNWLVSRGGEPAATCEEQNNHGGLQSANHGTFLAGGADQSSE